MEIHLKVIGILFILLSFIHFIFPSYFKWKEELVHLSLINRQLMYVHTFFIALVVFMIGLLCLTSSKDLMTTTLGRKIALGLTIFWTIRLLVQFFGYSHRLWWGKRFETAIHILFAIFWTYVSGVFWWVYWIES